MSAVVAIALIVACIAIQAGAGKPIMAALDRWFERRYCKHGIIVDEEGK